MSRPRTDPVDRAIEMVLDLTIEQRNAFTVALRQIEKRFGALVSARTAEPKPKRTKSTPVTPLLPLEPKPEASNV